MGTAVIWPSSTSGAGRVVAPPAVVEGTARVRRRRGRAGLAGLTARDLDAIDAVVVTGAALAIADTGVLVLDGDRWCGRRAITLMPDLHVCVVRRPGRRARARGDRPTRPDAPSDVDRRAGATSDIELDRVEGVHGPRTLIVVLAGYRGGGADRIHGQRERVLQRRRPQTETRLRRSRIEDERPLELMPRLPQFAEQRDDEGHRRWSTERGMARTRAPLDAPLTSTRRIADLGHRRRSGGRHMPDAPPDVGLVAGRDGPDERGDVEIDRPRKCGTSVRPSMGIHAVLPASTLGMSMDDTRAGAEGLRPRSPILGPRPRAPVRPSAAPAPPTTSPPAPRPWFRWATAGVDSVISASTRP